MLTSKVVGAVLTIAILSAGTVSAQVAAGNADKDGTVVPKFVVPGGAASVGNAGEAHVSVPIVVPPGVRGVAPNLSLEYSAGAPDDGLGSGWAISVGYPDSIRRSVRMGIPSYGASDVFMYGGQDLVLSNGTYRTKVDSFELIQAFNNLEYWVVTQKDGTRLEYGRTADARSELVGRGAYAWHLSRVVDASDNAVEYTYEGDSSARRLSIARYTLRGSAPVGQEQSVVFDWGAGERPDPRSSSIYGGVVRIDRRLERIETRSNQASGGAVRVYELVYGDEPEATDLGTEYVATAKANSLLVGLKERGLGGIEAASLPPRKFRYQQTEPGWSEEGGEEYLVPVPIVYREVNQNLTQFVVDSGTRMADLNGDGWTDMVFSGLSAQAVYLHKGPHLGWQPIAWSAPYAFVRKSPQNPSILDEGVRLLDVNGDGRADLVRAASFYLKNEVRMNTGNGWAAPNTGYTLPDEIKFVKGDDTYSEDQGVQFGDVDGDGLADLLIARPDLRAVYLNKRNVADPTKGTWQLASSASLWDLSEADLNDPHFGNPLSFFWIIGQNYQDAGVRLVDVNADGLVDIVRGFRSLNRAGDLFDAKEVFLNDGRGWTRSNYEFPLVFGELDRDFGVQIADVDGDGYADAIGGDPLVENGKNYVHLNSQSSGFVKMDGVRNLPYWPVPVEFRYGPLDNLKFSDTGVRSLDADGNGRADWIQTWAYYPALTGFSQKTFLAKGDRSDLLLEYTNPLDGVTEFEYGPISGLGLTSSRMPMIRTVVTRMTQDAPYVKSAQMRSGYEYRRGLYDWKERDFMGFERVHETRLGQERTVRERQFFLDAGRRGLVYVDASRDLGDGKLYSAQVRDYKSSFQGGVYTTLLDQESFWKFHHSSESQRGTWKKRYRYGDYGNVAIVWETDFSGAVVRTTHTEYVPNASAYIVSLPSVVTRYEGEFVPAPTTKTQSASARGSKGSSNVSAATGNGAKQLSSESLAYDGQSFGQAPTHGLVTERVLRDPLLEGKSLASGSTSVSTKFKYDPYGDLTEETNGRGYTTVYDWADNGYLFPHTISRDCPGCQGVASFRKVMKYDRAMGVLTRVEGFNAAAVTTYDYDGLGRVRFVFQPGDTTTASVDATYHLHRDERGELDPTYIEITQRVDGSRNRIAREYYDGLGRPAGNFTFNGVNWTVTGLVEYDSRGRKALVCDPFFASKPDFNDKTAAGASKGGGMRIADEELRCGKRYTKYEYEDEKVVTTTLPGGATVTHEHTADGVYTMDEKRIRTFKRHDAFGQLVELITDVDGTGTTHTTTRNVYDGMGRLKEVRRLGQPDHVTEYFHDARGMLRGLNSPDSEEIPRNGYKIWNDYDEQGNQTHRWAGLDVWKEEFDAVDRPTRLYVSRAGGAPGTFFADSVRAYDRGANGLGHLTAVVGYGYKVSGQSQVTANTFTFDERGRVKEEAFSFANLDKSLSNVRVVYQYDNENHVTDVRDPRGRWIRYKRNLLGQIAGPSAVTYDETRTVVSTLEYDPAGRMNSITFGHGAVDIFTYDVRGRVEEIMGSGPLQMKYTYDLAGNLETETHAGRPLAVTYGYDNLHRLHSATNTGGGTQLSLTYGYDERGNVLTVSGQGATDLTGAPVSSTTFTYTGGKDRLSSVAFDGASPIDASFDEHGNMTGLARQGTSAYSRMHNYDGLGRVQSYALNFTGTNRSGAFVYDGQGRKIMAVRDGVKEIYFRTIDGSVLATFEVSGPQLEDKKWTTYVMAEGRRVASIDHQDKLSFIHSDRLGSARAITEASSGTPKVVWRGDYLPFGSEMQPQADGDNFKFTGQELDRSFGIYDYGARYYDPVLRRFLQIDSYMGSPGDPRTLNRYSYALNNPTGVIDPTGHGGEGANETDNLHKPCEASLSGNCGYANYNGGTTAELTDAQIKSLQEAGYVVITKDEDGGWWNHTAKAPVSSEEIQKQMDELYDWVVFKPIMLVTSAASAAEFVVVGLFAAPEGLGILGVRYIPMKIAKDGTWFWSNRLKSEAAAAAVSAGNGAKTLEMTMVGRFAEFMSGFMSSAGRNAMWEAASQRIASGASGVVNIVVGGKVRLDSILATVEMKELLKNVAVTAIRWH